MMMPKTPEFFKKVPTERIVPLLRLPKFAKIALTGLFIAERLVDHLQFIGVAHQATFWCGAINIFLPASKVVGVVGQVLADLLHG